MNDGNGPDLPLGTDRSGPEGVDVARETVRWEAGRTSPQPAPSAAVVAVIAARLDGVEASDLAYWVRTGELPDDAR